MRLNPCELEIDLFCKGMTIDPSCDLGRDARGLSRTRAGLGSGLEIVIPGAPPLGKEIWANVPVTEDFVRDSPYALRPAAPYDIVDRRTGEAYAVRLPAEPAWYARRTTSGKEMRQVGVLQGTYLAIYVGVSCTFWHPSRQQQCRFCTTGLNVDAKVRKTVDDVVETALAAKAESGITFVHFNSGYQEGDGTLHAIAPYVKAVKEKVGLLVGVQEARVVVLEVDVHPVEITEVLIRGLIRALDHPERWHMMSGLIRAKKPKTWLRPMFYIRVSLTFYSSFLWNLGYF